MSPSESVSLLSMVHNVECTPVVDHSRIHLPEDLLGGREVVREPSNEERLLESRRVREREDRRGMVVVQSGLVEKQRIWIRGSSVSFCSLRNAKKVEIDRAS